MIERPNGMQPQDYKGAKKWSCKQWAWEFLRRNEEFFKACGELHWTPNPPKEAELAEKFGLAAFKNARFPYKVGGKPKFVVRIVSSRMRMTEDDPQHYTRNLKVGEIVIRFPLYAALDDLNVLDSQLKITKKVLLRQLTALAGLTGKKATRRRERQTLDFLQLLRLLDALAAGVPKEKIFAAIFEEQHRIRPEDIDSLMKENIDHARVTCPLPPYQSKFQKSRVCKINSFLR